MALAVKNWTAVVVSVVAVIVADVYIFTSSLSFSTKAIIFRAHFIFGIQVVLFFLSRYVWRRLGGIFDSHSEQLEKVKDDATTTARGLSRSGPLGVRTPCTVVWRIILFVYLICCHVSYLTNLYFIGTEPAFISMVTYICLGSFVHLITGMLIMGILGCIGRLLQLKRYNANSRRRLRTLAAMMYALSISFYGLYTAHKLPTVKHVRVPVKDLPPSLEGFRIVQLSDIHLGPTVGRSKVKDVVEITNQLQPDIVVLTGDLVDGSVDRLHKAAEPLQQLQTTFGKFYVTGNHEYYTGDVDNWMRYVETLGFTALDNANAKISHQWAPAEQICIAGTNDIDAERIGYKNHRMNLDQALAMCNPKYPTILLAHQPKAAKLALSSKHRVDLVLSGHTHGGQMFPLIIGAYLINPFFAGLYKYGPSSHVYVSMGTVYWGIPMRVFTTREISEIILTRM
ncbi:transmembrane protein with metallophosphoesterase domain-like [Liolophura sinensis]|uniref:transmembrane protein with metallophosphoesterase domain-like n=1 Tax=Liolophura sinensis TaxID=3198878 RepID=UPI00315843E4